MITDNDRLPPKQTKRTTNQLTDKGKREDIISCQCHKHLSSPILFPGVAENIEFSHFSTLLDKTRRSEWNGQRLPTRNVEKYIKFIVYFISFSEECEFIAVFYSFIFLSIFDMKTIALVIE